MNESKNKKCLPLMGEMGCLIKKKIEFSICYAMTIHKSQIMLLERFKAEFGNEFFAQGVCFVGIQRVKS